MKICGVRRVRELLASCEAIAAYTGDNYLPLMWRFYNSRLTCDLATALAQAQRETLTASDASPLFWAAFALFGDPAALPAPGICWSGPARLWQGWHARRFPLPFPALTKVCLSHDRPSSAIKGSTA